MRGEAVDLIRGVFLLPRFTTPVHSRMSDDLTTFLASSAPEYKNPPPPRLQVLYSDIYRQKESNAEGFKSSIAWWTKTLKALVSAGKQPHSSDHLILHMSNHLLDALRWEKSGRPLGLGAVVVSPTFPVPRVPRILTCLRAGRKNSSRRMNSFPCSLS